MGEQRIAGDVERHTQKQVGAALVELTAQPAIGDVELEERMTGRQRHPLDFADVPGRHDDAPGIGIGAQQIQRRADLVDVLTGWSRPRSPLYTVDRPEFACITCPFVPDGDSVLVQPTDIGIAAQKPQQLVGYRFEMDFLGSEQRETGRQIIAHLLAEQAAGSGAGAVGFGRTRFEHEAQQVLVWRHD